MATSPTCRRMLGVITTPSLPSPASGGVKAGGIGLPRRPIANDANPPPYAPPQAGEGREGAERVDHGGYANRDRYVRPHRGRGRSLLGRTDGALAAEFPHRRGDHAATGDPGACADQARRRRGESRTRAP